jgi:hypothetical protein
MGFASGNAESQPQRYAYLKNTEQLAVEQEFSGGILPLSRRSVIGCWGRVNLSAFDLIKPGSALRRTKFPI